MSTHCNAYLRLNASTCDVENAEPAAFATHDSTAMWVSIFTSVAMPLVAAGGFVVLIVDLVGAWSVNP